MTKADFFSLALKIIGVYLIIPIVQTIAQLIVFFTQILSQQFELYQSMIEPGEAFLLWLFSSGIVPLVIYILCAWLLIMKSQYLTHKFLPLTEHNDKVELGLNTVAVFQIAFVIAGVILLLQGIPDTAYTIFQYFKRLTTNGNPGIADLDLNTLSTTFFGFLFIAFSSPLAQFLAKKSNPIKSPAEENN